MNYNAKEIISCLEKTEFMDCTDWSDKTFDKVGDDISASLDDLELDNTEWAYFSGATKGVFIPEDGDYVIKIPFLASHLKDGFKDYCELEQFIYYKAASCGISKFFAKIVKIGEVNGNSVYVQEKAYANVSDWDVGSKRFSKEVSKKSLKKMKKFCKKNKTKDFNISFLSLIKEREEEETFLKLYKFMKKNINDVHAGNVGMIDGNPVLIDYSGFYE